MTFDLIATLTLGVGTQIMRTTYLLIMLYLSVKFHQICFSSLRDIAETRFVTDGRTDGAILICHPKFLRGHKKKEKKTVTTISYDYRKEN